jgi:hypothetical protein
VLGRRHHLKLHHDSASSAGRILDLAPVLGLAINGDVLPQSLFNPMAGLTVPARHALIDTDELRWTKVRSSMRVYSFDKVAHKSQPVRHRSFVVSTLGRPAKGQRRPDIVESFPRHPSLRAKCWRLQNTAPSFGPPQVRPVTKLVPGSQD